MDSELQDLADRTITYAGKSGIQYCDVRAEQQERKSVLLENNQIEYTRTNDDRGIGIRILKDSIWGFCSITNPQSFDQIKDAIDNSIRNTKHYTKNERTSLYPNTVNKNKTYYPVLKKPELEDIIKVGLECSEIILGVEKIIKSSVNPWYTVNSKYFVNSEGSEILQNFTDTIVEMVATSHESGITQSVNRTEGGRGGMEQIITNEKIFHSARDIASKASELTNVSVNITSIKY